MHLFKRNSVYWYEFVHNGARYRQSTKLKNRRDAQDVASAFRTALVKGDVGIIERKKAPVFADAMEAFLDWASQENQMSKGSSDRYRYSSYALLKFFKGPVDRIDASDVEKFKTSRAGEMVTVRAKKGRKVSKNRIRPATVNRELACLRAMFNHLAKEHRGLRNPVSEVKFLAEANQQDRVLTFAEQEVYLEVASPNLKDVAGLILETGMRPEEVYTLQKSAIHKDWLKVEKGKTPAAKRRVDLNPDAQRIIESRLIIATRLETTCLFPNEDDSKRPITGVQRSHSRALAQAGLLPFRPYDLRHTWATRAAEAGVDLVTLAAMLGHSRIQMVMRYAHPTQSHRADALKKLATHKKVRVKQERWG